MCWFVYYTMRVWFYSEIKATKNTQQDAPTNATSLHVSTNVSNTVSTSVPITTNTTILLHLDNDETTNNDNVPNTTIDFDFDDTLDSDSDSNDRDESNDDSDNEEESILMGATTPLAPKLYQDIDETKDTRELFPWTLAQRHCTKILYNTMCDNNQPQQTKIEAMRRFFSQFIFHKVGGDKFYSALIHFMAVLGIDEENCRLKELINFSYILAGLTQDMRVLGTKLLLLAAKWERQLNEPSQAERFLEQRQEYLSNGGGTPMSELINLLAYRKYVVLNSSNVAMITWSCNKDTIFYKGIIITLSSFR